MEHRTVEDLRQDAERTRAQLTGTVDQLRSKVSETASEFRQRASPDAIKAGVGEYVRNKGQLPIEKARQNPLAATAIAAGLSYPVLRLVKSIPGPMFLIGSGLFLMASPTGQRINAATKTLAGSAFDRAEAANQGLRQSGTFASNQLTQAAEAAKGAASAVGEAVRRSAWDGASHVLSAAVSLSSAVAAGIDDLPQNGSAAAEEAGRAVRRSAEGAATAVRNAAGAALDYGSDTASQLKERAMDAPRHLSESLGHAIQEYPILAGSVALGAGVLLASALPRSNIERVVAGSVVEAARFGAAELAAQGLEAARTAASEVINEAAERARKEELDANAAGFQPTRRQANDANRTRSME
jgi:hypothetical protein